jgi:ABC-type sugar transport system substrate-binding protein
MTFHRRRRTGRWFLGPLVAACVVVMAAGCSSSASSGSTNATPTTGSTSTGSAAGAHATASAITQANAIIAAAEKPLPFWAPPAFNAAPARGKTVWWIASHSVSTETEWAAAAQQAFQLAGVNFKFYNDNDQQDVAAHIQGIQLAIAAHANAIVLGDGGAASEYTAQIAAAKKAGIPVFVIVNGDPEPQPNIPGLIVDTTYSYTETGQLSAAWAVAHTNGAPNTLIVNLGAACPCIPLAINGFLTELKTLDPNAVVHNDTLALNESEMQDQVATFVRTGLLTDPSTNFVYPVFDNMAAFAVTGISGAQKSATVSTGGFNAVVPSMEELKAGSTLQYDIGGPNDWLSWATADNVLRYLTGHPVITNPHIGLRIFTHDNVQNINVTQENDLQWYGINLAEDYAKVWEIG